MEEINKISAELVKLMALKNTIRDSYNSLPYYQEYLDRKYNNIARVIDQACLEIANLLDAIAKKYDWIKCKDILPKEDGRSVLITEKGYDLLSLVTYNREKEGFVGDDGLLFLPVNDVAAWMYAPKPYKEA